MFKTGLKLWSTNADNYAKSAQDLYSNGFFDYIELYVVPDTITTIQKWKSLKIPYIIHCTHSSHGFNLAKSEFRQFNIDVYRQAKLFADELNAQYIIFHGGMGGSISETAKQLSDFNEKRALIENKPYRPLPNAMNDTTCRGYDVLELNEVVKAANCGVCLDFVHAFCAANSLKYNAYTYVSELINTFKPQMFHLTDIDNADSEFDSHHHLGTGQLKLGKLLSELPEDSIITLETAKNSKHNLDDFIADVMLLRKFDITLRPANSGDIKNVFELANEESVRANSFITNEITWHTHKSWFTEKISSENVRFFIAENKLNEFIGQIRFDCTEHNNFTVSMSIMPEFRLLSISANLLKRASDIILSENKLAVITAWIKTENTKSLKCFKKAGYQIKETLSDRFCLTKKHS